VLAINCLREREHPTHLSFERSLEYIGRIAPKRAYLVHMCHDFTHEEWLAKLAGTNVEPAYDGMEIEL
jgi:phosphoribosyl 1,2-cyclic phosphate phosphodiesterase